MQSLLKTTRQQGVNAILLRRLAELQRESVGDVVLFNLVFHRLCSWFSIKKTECWDLLYYLQDNELIEIAPYRGIKIKIN